MMNNDFWDMFPYYGCRRVSRTYLTLDDIIEGLNDEEGLDIQGAYEFCGRGTDDEYTKKL